MRRHEVARKLVALERHIDDLDLRSRQRDELMETLNRRAIGIERAGILRRAETLPHLIIVSGAQIERRRRDRKVFGPEFIGEAAHRVGNRDTGAEPGFVIVAAFAFEHAADPVQLADIDAAIWRGAQHVHKSRRPAVIAGKVHEIFR